MRCLTLIAALALPLTPAFAQDAAPPASPGNLAPKPAALVADGMPPVPADLAAATRPYMENRGAGFSGWHPTDKSMLIGTRFGNTAQLHRVGMPMGARKQLTFEAEPVGGGSWAPIRGDILLVQKDRGGDEFFQIYALKSGRLERLTDGGRSRNGLNAWSADGELVAYTSTRRNGRDSDIYVMDPRNPASNRMVAEVSGGGWGLLAFSSDKTWALVGQRVSVTKANLFTLDLAKGGMTPIGDHRAPISYQGAQIAQDGAIWVTSDEGSEFQRLGMLDRATGRFTPKSTEKWDVSDFDISEDGSFVAYTINEAGMSKLRLMDMKSGGVRTVDALPAGIIGGIEIAPWGEIGLTFTSARSAADVWSVDPRTLKLTRWTESETGGLDVTQNVEPELVKVRSFDGLEVSGFLYRPDPRKFPGKRALIMNVHGGPEGQSTPGFQGRNNFLLNEEGVAIFYPNVRGSTGYGKTFVSLDNGPFKREDSVKDMGAFLDHLAKDPALDASRFGLTGGSYGGYMCYAAALHYQNKLKSNLCVVAISNFVTFLEKTESYRRDLRRVEYGDEREAAQRAKLMEISPLTRAAEIKKPLFVVTGANDPRVPKAEADQMVAAVRANGGTAWHLIGMNEGHGFAKKENADYNFWAGLMFWRETLLK
jgi:dipeptidyl aminopeptidase/acylaminoacyl peptidase